MQPNTYLISIHSSSVKKCVYILSIYSWLWKHNSLALQVFLLLVLFCSCLTTTETIFPSIPLLDRALKNASVSVSKVHSIPHCGGNFPKDVILFPPFLTLKHPQSEAHTCTHALHACLRTLFIFVLSIHPAVSHVFLVSWWWKAPAVLSRNPSPPYVTDILPALFTSRVVAQSLLGEA